MNSGAIIENNGAGGGLLNGAQLLRTENEGLSEKVRFIRPDPEGQARQRKCGGQGENARDPGSGTGTQAGPQKELIGPSPAEGRGRPSQAPFLLKANTSLELASLFPL